MKEQKGSYCFLITADSDGLYIHCHLKRSLVSVKKENFQVFVTNLGKALSAFWPAALFLMICNSNKKEYV